jgi:uncharacterized membrane protein
VYSWAQRGRTNQLERANAQSASPETPADNDQLVDRLADEYKILQDKIDKIGAFRFTIKGWSITVIIAGLFAGTAANSVHPVVLFLCLIVVLCLFLYFEKTQTDLSHHFGQRAISIETVLSRLLRKSARGRSEFVDLRFIPGIAHHLGRQHPKSQSTRRSTFQSLRDADLYFYVIQAMLVIAVVFVHGYGRNAPSPGDQVIVFHNAGPSESSGSRQTSSVGYDTNHPKDNVASPQGSSSNASKGGDSQGRVVENNEKDNKSGRKGAQKKSD